jgi:hypothetical protein
MNLDPDKALITDLTKPGGCSLKTYFSGSLPSRFSEDIMDVLNKPGKDEENQNSIIERKMLLGVKTIPKTAKPFSFVGNLV